MTASLRVKAFYELILFYCFWLPSMVCKRSFFSWQTLSGKNNHKTIAPP